MNKEYFLQVINKLPHSKDRMPYTYHHDYLRLHSKKHRGMSRSDVASSYTPSEEMLYAVALTQLVDELGSEVIKYVGLEEDWAICKEAKKIAENVILSLNVSVDWDKFANALKNEFGEGLVEEDGSEEDAYNWWLTDVTVTDIVEFTKQNFLRENYFF